jgi:Uma2 family endonuclease
MVMPLVVPRYTLQDLESFPDDGSRYELLDGVLLVTPAPLPLHQLVVSRIDGALTEHLRPANLARVFVPGVVELEPNLHLEPDILVVPAGEPAAGIGPETRWGAIREWWLAVEVSGEGSRLYDRDHKAPAYLVLGVREVWRVDLRERCVFVSRPDSSDVQHLERVVWHPPELNKPLVVSVPDLFLP